LFLFVSSPGQVFACFQYLLFWSFLSSPLNRTYFPPLKFALRHPYFFFCARRPSLFFPAAYSAVKAFFLAADLFSSPKILLFYDLTPETTRWQAQNILPCTREFLVAPHFPVVKFLRPSLCFSFFSIFLWTPAKPLSSHIFERILH